MVFKTGFDDFQEDLKREEAKSSNNFINRFMVPKDGKKEAIFLDDTGFRFEEHNVYDPTTRRSKQFTCSGDENCCLCQLRDRTAMVTVSTVKDMNGYIDQRTGQRKNVGQKQIFAAKKDASKRMMRLRETVALQKAENWWNNQQEQMRAKGFNNVEEIKNKLLQTGGVLKNCRISCERLGDKSERVGDEFAYKGLAAKDLIQPTDTPFEYEKIFAVKPEAVIKQEILEFFGPNDKGRYAALFPQMQQAQVQQQSNMQEVSTEPERHEAPSFNADDIPF